MKVNFIEDCLEGDAASWFDVEQADLQESNPNRKFLYEALVKRFINPEDANITKTELMRLRHSWGKATEYLGKFTHYVKLIGISEDIQLTIMLFQVRPTINHAFSQLPTDKQTLEELKNLLIKYDASKDTYCDEVLERQANYKDKEPLIANLLGIHGSLYSRNPIRKPSRSFASKPKSLPSAQKGKSNSSNSENKSNTPNGNKNSKPSSNNPHSNYLCEEQVKQWNLPNPDPAKYPVVLTTVKPHKGNKQVITSSLLDTGSTTNIIHMDLVKMLGIKTIPSDTVVKVMGGNVLMHYITEEFIVEMNLAPLGSTQGEVRRFKLRCHVTDQLPSSILLGSKFLKTHFFCILTQHDHSFIIKLGPTTTELESNSGLPPCQRKDDFEEVQFIIEIKDSPSDETVLNVNDQNPELTELIKSIPKEYLDLLEAFNEDRAEVLPEHRVYDCSIDLKPNATLYYGPVYPTTPTERQIIKEYVDDMERKGFIRRSRSPAGYPILVHDKKDGGSRICVDYRKLNDQTIKNAYPIPLVLSVFESMKGAQYFTKLDLKSAYNLIRIKEGDEYKTAFRTEFGHYEYLVMPFGLTNAPAVFQSFINDIFNEQINRYVQVYLDDIIIYSKTLEEHIQHVRTVLQLIIDNHLVAKLKKCEFHKSEVEFLGHIISREGIKTDPKKIEAVKNWPIPTTVKEVQSFVGLCNYYRRFISDFSKVAKPLHSLTKKNVNFKWTDECNKSFNLLKELLTSAPVLLCPDHEKPFVVECDASDYAIGGVLSQEGEDKALHPVYYFSRTLNSAELNYSTTEKELLAIRQAFIDWRHLLQGAKYPITVYSDHRNLLFATKPQLLSQRQARWQEYFATFDFRIIYRPGKKNGKADVLSRRPDHLLKVSKELSETSLLQPSQLEGFNDDKECYFAMETNFIDDLKQCYLQDETACQILKDLEVPIQDYPWTLSDGLLVRSKHPEQVYVPNQLRLLVIKLNHDAPTAGHLGVDKTYDILKRNFYWNNMRQDVESFIRSCCVCKAMKSDHHAPYGSMVRIPLPELPWQHLQIDFITDLPSRPRNSTSSFDPSNPNHHQGTIMVTSCYLTKMIHLVGFKHLPTARDTATAFLNHIFKLHGFPLSIVTDRGTQFDSRLWSQLMEFFNIDHRIATTGHHRTIGQVERNNDYVETYLCCFTEQFDDLSWMDHLYLAEFCYNNSIHASTKQPPFLAVYNYQIHSNPQVADLVSSLGLHPLIDSFSHNLADLKHTLEINRNRYLDEKDKHLYPNFKRFKVHDLVWLRKPVNYHPPLAFKLQTRKYGPFKVTGVDESKLNYRLDLSTSPFPRIYPIFHISELEPYYPTPHNLLHNHPNSNEITKILNSRKSGHFYEYLVTFADSSQRWINADIIDKDDYYSKILSDYLTSNSPTPFRTNHSPTTKQHRHISHLRHSHQHRLNFPSTPYPSFTPHFPSTPLFATPPQFPSYATPLYATLPSLPLPSRNTFLNPPSWIRFFL